MKKFLLLLICLLLIGCNNVVPPAEREASNEVDQSREPEVADASPTPAATATPVEPTTQPKPTPTPSPTATALALEPVPRPRFDEAWESSPTPDTAQEWIPTEALLAWLLEARAADVPAAEIFAELQGVGWLESADDWYLVDVDGDGRDEWLLTIYLHPAEVVWGRPGDFWIIGDEGMHFRFFAPGDYYCAAECPSDMAEFWGDAPQILAITDMTGDEQPESVLMINFCGAHTCTQRYFVLSNHHGVIENLVSLPSDRYRWGDMVTLQYDEGLAETIMLPYSEFHGVEDATEDGLPDLIIQGGQHGSAGAGIQRTRTEVWGWNEEAIALQEVHWDPTEYRVHLLWEGNDAYYVGEYEQARSLLMQVIEDDSLQETPYDEGTEYDSVRRFAAFRLLLIALLEENRDEVARWQAWLSDNYPEASLTEAATMLVTQWESEVGLSDACEAVTSYLLDAESAAIDKDEPGSTGDLRDMGYANPSLSADDACLLVGGGEG